MTTAPRWNLGEGWDAFGAVWLHIGAHANAYGWAPRYRKAAEFLASGGFMSAAMRAGKESK